MSKVGDYILNIGWVKRSINKSKKLCLPGFEGLPLYDVLVFFFKEIKDAQLNDRAASISFFFLLAIPPTCIFLFTLLPYIPLKDLENTLYILVGDLTPNQNTYNIVHNIIYDFLHTQRTGLLSFSFLLAVLYSSSAVLGILRSFNKFHPKFKKRGFFKRRWTALKINCLLILLLILSVVLMVAQSSVFTNLLATLHITEGGAKFFVDLVRWVIIILLFFTVISLIYTYGPAIEERWKFITAGSTLATALTILSTLGFSYYVNNFSNYNQIYGSIGSIIVLMVWIYINSFVLLIGFELNASIELLRQEALARKEKDEHDEEEVKGFA
jgi:membrane protein